MSGLSIAEVPTVRAARGDGGVRRRAVRHFGEANHLPEEREE
jgi:hypothetical protein